MNKYLKIVMIGIILFTFISCTFANADSGMSNAVGISLKDILPRTFEGLKADIFIPPGPSDVKSNAVESYSADYKKDGINRVTVFAVKTVNELYNHQLQICSRCHGSTLETCSQVNIKNIVSGADAQTWYWYSCFVNGEALSEAITFTVFINEETRTISVDSHWLTEEYTIPKCDAVYNFQIWSSDSVLSYKMLKTILETFHSLKGWKLDFLNTTHQASPTVYFKNAAFTSTGITVEVASWLEEERVVNFEGSYRKPWDKEKIHPFNRKFKIKRGVNTIKIDLDSVLLDLSVYIENDGFKDILYAANSSTWSSFKNENSKISMELFEEVKKAEAKDSCSLWGNLKLTGKVGKNGWCGVFKALNANNLPMDISKYKYLNFYARGKGDYRINLESSLLRDKGNSDFHQTSFTAEVKGKLYKIPLSGFKQRWGSDFPYTGKDIVSIAFVAEYPLKNIDLEIREISFSKN
jgi:hypothetical protein